MSTATTPGSQGPTPPQPTPPGVRRAPLGQAHGERPAQHPRARRLREIALGARLASAGGRDARARDVLTAAGVAVAVALLLLASSVPNIGSARDRRANAAQGNVSGPRRLLMLQLSTYYDGRTVNGTALQPLVAHAPVPPGVRTLPGPGEIVVSPALEALLQSSSGARWREMLDARVLGTIGAAGLTGPQELLYYRGADDLRKRTTAYAISGFGPNDNDGGVRSTLGRAVILTLEIMLVVGLLSPVAQFVATAARFGSERRNERLAAIRLLGADRSTTARIAAGESLPGVLAGMVLGGLLFVLARPLISHVHVFGLSVYGADVRPQPALVAAIALGVPLLCVTRTVASMRRVMSDPLGTTRRGRPSRLRAHLHLIAPVVGLLLVVGLALGAYKVDDVGGSLTAAAGVLLTLVGVAAMTPLLVQWLVERSGGRGGVAWLLAVRRVRHDQGSAGRVVGTVALAAAGAIALQVVFGSVNARYSSSAGYSTYVVDNVSHRVPDSAEIVSIRLRSPQQLSALERRLTHFAGAGSVSLAATTAAGQGRVLVAGCDTLSELPGLSDCRADSVYVQRGGSLKAGGRLRLGGQTLTVPRNAQPARLQAVVNDADNGQLLTVSSDPELVLTPLAAQRLGLRALTATGTVELLHPFTTDFSALNLTLARIDPVAALQGFGPVTGDSTLKHFNQILVAGALLVLLTAAFSVLIATADQLRERRVAIAGLMALGTRPRTLSLALIWQIAIPLVLGLLLAISVGLGLGTLITVALHQPLTIDPGVIAALAGLGVVLVGGVTLASLPLLRRQMRPTALRTE